MALSYNTGFSERFYTAADGLTLYARIYGEHNSGLPVVCLPGLSRNSRDFHQLALALSGHEMHPFRVVCLDYRGRGRSARDPDASHYTLPVETGDVMAACAALQIQRAAFIGTSRGGLTLHLLIAAKPDLIAGAVLNDVGPVLEAEGLRQIQAYLGRGRNPSSWEDAAELLRETHGRDFPALSPQDWRDMADAIYSDREGEIVADFDPRIAVQIRDIDLTQPLSDLWPQFEAFAPRPVMVVRGEHSRLLSRETVEAMAARHQGLQVRHAEGQGHAPLLHIDGINEDIAAFLRSL